MTPPRLPEYTKLPNQDRHRLIGYWLPDGRFDPVTTPQPLVTLEEASAHWQRAKTAQRTYRQQRRQSRQSTRPSQTPQQRPQPIIDIPPTPPQTFALAAQLQHARLHGHTSTLPSSPAAYRQPIQWQTCTTCGRTERDCRCLPAPSSNCFARVVEQQRTRGLIT